VKIIIKNRYDNDPKQGVAVFGAHFGRNGHFAGAKNQGVCDDAGTQRGQLFPVNNALFDALSMGQTCEKSF
jgi:hypothetical protein